MTPGEFNRKKRFFRTWLEKHGARILPPSDRKRDLLRFAAQGKIGLVHRGPKDRLIFMPPADEAWKAYLDGTEWSAGDVPAITEDEVAAAPARRPRKPRAPRPKPPPYPLQQLVDGRVAVPGIYIMPPEVYHGDPAPEPSLSSSGARLMHQTCPQIFWHRRMDPPAPTKALERGIAAHTWILEGEAWEQRYELLSPRHSGRSAVGKSYEERIRAAGKTPLPYAEWAAIKAMKEAIEAHPFARAAFRGGRPEMSMFWRDEMTGMWCRTRPDYTPDAGEILVDYMTARSVHPEDLRKTLVDYAYDMKGEWLARGARAVGLMKSPKIAFVFQQADPPYPIVVATLSATTLMAGRIKNDAAIARFARGLRTGTWASYAEEVVELDLPAWEALRIERQSEAGRFDVARILRGVSLSPPEFDPAAAARAADVAATP